MASLRYVVARIPKSIYGINCIERAKCPHECRITF